MTPSFSPDKRNYWAFQRVNRPAIPKIDPVRPSPSHSDRVDHPVDTFVLDRLRSKGLGFSIPARKQALLRRAKFDLLGLPPSVDEIEQFLSDTAPDAYPRLIDRLLASPHYGEKWGRHWLDLVRFAETAGFNADPIRPLAYKYRDYVIRAFSSDTPYDHFVRQQLAGDELFPHDPEAVIATGFNRMWPDESNASNILLARQDALNDLTANVGAVFLGLSVGCAQCHDHKFDPILQTDFYRLQSFFVGIVPKDKVPIGTRQQLAEYRRQLDEWLVKTESIRSELHQIEHSSQIKASKVKRRKFPDIVLKAIDAPTEHRTAFQHQLAFWSERQIVVTEKQLLAQMDKMQASRHSELKKLLTNLRMNKPQPPKELTAMVSVEVDSALPRTYLLAGGSYNKPLQEVRPGFLSIIQSSEARPQTLQTSVSASSGRRASLARWITDTQNPLTARVMANRIWQGHFGRGLVANASDFGIQTPPPTHPKLLDWLASEFVAQGWSLKSMHRLIMTSKVYCQSTQRSTESTQADPSNQLYGSYPRQRLEAESIRDAMLSLAGKLNTKMYGPGVKPPLPPKFSSREKWDISKSSREQNRRSVYIHAKRNLPYPLLQVFDLPDMHESCAHRAQTTVAPQALMVLNSELIFGLARAFSERLLDDHSPTEPASIVRASYVAAFGREPSQEEIDAAIVFINQQQKLIGEQLDNSNNAQARTSADRSPKATLVDFCHALMNANEFIYID